MNTIASHPLYRVWDGPHSYPNHEGLTTPSPVWPGMMVSLFTSKFYEGKYELNKYNLYSHTFFFGMVRVKNMKLNIFSAISADTLPFN